jgi:hypothetical protein
MGFPCLELAVVSAPYTTALPLSAWSTVVESKGRSRTLMRREPLEKDQIGRSLGLFIVNMTRMTVEYVSAMRPSSRRQAPHGSTHYEQHIQST